MQRFVILITCLIGAGVLTAQAQPTKTATGKVPVVLKKTVRAVTPITYTGRQIAVGSGGGFTGFSTTYYLLDNGQLFGRRSRDTTFTLIAKQTAANTKRVFKTVESNCKIKTTHFDNPGNTYRFVQWQKGKQAYKVTWGIPEKTVPANYQKFYDSFMTMIPASLRLK
ncbi:FAD-binding oxidoreductase [Spirosoma endbachense]|uniref:FAD-binding oxidoreductase n=1 Tax=Spirosoma endbachense TaxID=2666025 RepID=UPI001E5FC29D|nr:FAD-binding oxidoreductase [Spirosoma endbachense]